MKGRDQVPFSFVFAGWLREPLSIGLAKEIREIMPYFLVSALTGLMWLAGLPWNGGVVAGGCLVLGELATVAMGAAVFGNEFTHRTLSLVLVQPVARAGLWRRKLRALASLLAVPLALRIAILFMYGLAANSSAESTLFSLTGFMALSAAGFSLCVAPCAAMLGRSALAGVVFTVALPAVTWQASVVISAIRHGTDNWESVAAGAFATNLFVGLTLLQWVAGFFLARRLFVRMQVAESWQGALRLPAWLRGRGVENKSESAPAARGGLLGKLVLKELRLYAPTCLVAGIYCAICAVDWILGPGAGGIPSGVTTIASFMYAALVSLLVGALSCAEERHAGTLLWQLIQPLAAWRQWTVKTGVAIGVALVLAIGVPSAVAMAGQAIWHSNRTGLNLNEIGLLLGAFQVAVLCVIGIYVSSVCSTTLRAMLWSLPIGFVFETLLWGLLDSPEAKADWWNWFAPFETDGRSFLSWAGLLSLAFWGGMNFVVWLVVPLACAFQNFRQLDQRFSRVLAHLVVVAAVLVTAAVAWAFLVQIYRAAGVVLPEKPMSREERLAGQCHDHLVYIQAAASKWYVQHDQQIPPSLAALTNVLESPAFLVCPADETRKPVSDWESLDAAGISYDYIVPTGGASRGYAEIRCPIHSTSSTAPILFGIKKPVGMPPRPTNPQRKAAPPSGP